MSNPALRATQARAMAAQFMLDATMTQVTANAVVMAVTPAPNGERSEAEAIIEGLRSTAHEQLDALLDAKVAAATDIVRSLA